MDEKWARVLGYRWMYEKQEIILDIPSLALVLYRIAQLCLFAGVYCLCVLDHRDSASRASKRLILSKTGGGGGGGSLQVGVVLSVSLRRRHRRNCLIPVLHQKG